jgi:hypothetical protein
VEYTRLAAVIAENRHEVKSGVTIANEGSEGDEMYIIAEVNISICLTT